MKMPYVSSATLLLLIAADAFSTSRRQRTFTALSASNRKSSFVEEEAQRLQLEEKGADVVGADFFGGNKQKDELFDPVAEANANLVAGNQKYNRLDDPDAFDDLGKAVTASLQQQLNALLYVEEAMPSDPEYAYAPAILWETPLDVANKESPWDEVRKCLDWYSRMDVSIISAKATSNGGGVNLRWAISLVWPIFWEARVLLTGTTQLTLQGKTIVQQVDTLDQKDVLSTISPQIRPRFWDTYHIGMTPSAEISPMVAEGSLFSNLKPYKVYQIPPRLVYQPSILDDGDREDANAASLPNHCFCDVIKTMGPNRQRYVPTSPVEVQLIRNSNDQTRIVWTIPLSIEIQTNALLPLPTVDEETLPEAMAEAAYKYQERRKVATVPYGGFPQDPEVPGLRKKLYEQVMKDGLKPKLDENDRPQFFFRQNNVKACYTEGGLGMSVYEWRPKFVESNEVGIELEL
jgi:hypothetical protein